MLILRRTRYLDTQVSIAMSTDTTKYFLNRSISLMPQQAVGMGGTFIIMERQNVSWNIEALSIYRT